MSTKLISPLLEEFKKMKYQGQAAIAQLTQQDLLTRINPQQNSIAVIVKHLRGNLLSRFTDFLTSDGEKPDRHRDQEFEMVPGATRAEVMRWWEEGWAQVLAAVDALRPEDLMGVVTIRGEPHSVLQALNRQVAHYAYHVGQIVFLAKHLHFREWKSLSIPRGKSEEINQRLGERKTGPRS